MAKIGRPTLATPEMLTRICDLVATHELGLPSLCVKYPDLPEPQTINEWRRKNKEFSSSYALAKQFQAELLAESINDVAENLNRYSYKDKESGAIKIDAGMVAQARLLIDTRKWMAAKLAPKIYGERRLSEESHPQDTLSKIKSLVDDLNKTNSSEI